MVSKRPDWTKHVPYAPRDELIDRDAREFGMRTGWEPDGRRPGFSAMSTPQSDLERDLAMGFVPKEAMHRALTGRGRNYLNQVDRDQDEADVDEYLAYRASIEKDFGGLPSNAPKGMRDYYRNYIDGLLTAMDNQFRHSFFGRNSGNFAREWMGADTLGQLHEIARADAKAHLSGADLDAHRQGYVRAMQDYSSTIKGKYARWVEPGSSGPDPRSGPMLRVIPRELFEEPAEMNAEGFEKVLKDLFGK